MNDLRTSHRCGVLDLLKSRSLGNQTLHYHGVCSHLQQLAEDQAACGIHGERVCQLPTGVRSTFLMAFSPDKSKVASTHGDHKIYISDIQTGKCLHTLEGHPRTPWCIAFHPTYCDILASGCLGGQVRVWDLHGGSELWISDKKAVIASLAFHPTEKLLVIATSNELYFWDWRISKPLKKCKTLSDREKVRYIKFDPDGKFLITGIANRPLMETTFCSNVPNQQCTEEEHNLRNEMVRGVVSGQINAHSLLREYQRRQNDRRGPASPTNPGLYEEIVYQRAIDQILPQSQRNNAAENEVNTGALAGVSNGASQEPDQSLPVDSGSGLGSDIESGQRADLDARMSSSIGNTMSILSQTLISSLRRLHAALQLLTDNQMNDAWSRIPNGRARMLRIVTSILNRLNNLVRNTAATYDSMNMRSEINQEINHIAEQFLRLPPYGANGIPDSFFMTSNSIIELNQRLQDVIANLMQSLERITALELQYRNLGLMSSAVVSSPMPASSLNWRDERTVTILPNPFSQENMGTRPSSNSSELSLGALSANNINSRLHVNVGDSSFDRTTSSRIDDQQISSISDANSERLSNMMSSSSTSGRSYSLLRRINYASTNPFNNISVRVNSSGSHRPVRGRMRNLYNRLRNLGFLNPSENFTYPFENNQTSNPTSFGPLYNCANSNSFNNSTTSESSSTANNVVGSLAPSSGSVNETSESHSANSSAFELNYTDDRNPLSINFSHLESNVDSANMPSTSSDNNIPDQNLSDRSMSSGIGINEDSSSSNNDVDDLMDAALTIQSSSLYSTSDTSNSSDINPTSSSYLPDIREHFRIDHRENSGDSTNGTILNVSSGSAFRVPQVHIDPVDGNDTSGPPIDRPRSPPLDEVIARNLNMLPSSSDSMRQANNLRFSDPNNFSNFSGFLLGPTHLHANYTRGLSYRLWEDNSNYSRHVHSVLRRAIDRVISGVGGSMADSTLGGEILTHRIQKWNFSYLHELEISSVSAFVVVPECKIHNDASVDISSDGSLLAALVPVHRLTTQNYDGTMLGIYSLEKNTLGQCLYTWSFGMEAITVSFSPLSRYIMIGLASCRLPLTPSDRQAQTISKILKIECDKDHRELVFIQDLEYSNMSNRRQYVSLNAACWLPVPGDGIIFGTNRGDLRIRYPRHAEIVYAEIRSNQSNKTFLANHVTTTIAPASVVSATAATQTVQPDTHSIATQTSHQDFNI